MRGKGSCLGVVPLNYPRQESLELVLRAGEDLVHQPLCPWFLVVVKEEEREEAVLGGPAEVELGKNPRSASKPLEPEISWKTFSSPSRGVPAPNCPSQRSVQREEGYGAVKAAGVVRKDLQKKEEKLSLQGSKPSRLPTQGIQQLSASFL